MATFTSNGSPITNPSPQYDIPIICNNGTIKASPNLFNMNDLYGNYLLTDGGLVGSESQIFCLTNFIRVKPSTTYTFSFISAQDSQYRRVCGYSFADQDTFTRLLIKKAKPATVGVQYDLTFTTDANTNYIRISTVAADTNTQIVQGSTATTYRPYGRVYYDGTVETVQAHGKNLFDKALFNTDVGGTITYTTFEIPNGTYTMSTNFPISNNVTNVFIFAGEVTSGAAIVTNGVYDGQSQTITVTDGKYTVAYRSTTSSSSNTNNPKDYDFQLELGSTATTYEPYFEGTTATCQPLLSVGGYKDVQNITTGSVSRNIGIYLFDGTEDWTVPSGADYFRLDGMFEDVIPYSSDNPAIICSHFVGRRPRASTANMNDKEIKLGYTSKYNRLYIKYYDMTTVDDLKQWLASQYAAGTPVTIVYPLATSVSESVTPQTMTVAQGTNTVTATGSVDNLELEISYKAYAEVTVEEIEAVNTDESVEVTIG